MATLVLLKAGESTAYELSQDENVLGRHPECTVHVDSNMVSRKHARVFKKGSQFFIEDLGSGNGTTVNGVRVTSATLLGHEDRIKLGPILFRFEDIHSAPTRKSHKAPAPSDAFGVELSSDASATVLGALTPGRFGALDVQPEAKLRAVLEISRSLAGAVELPILLPKILDSLFSVFPAADRGCILVREPGSERLIPQAVKHRRAGDDESVKISRTILARVLREKTGILSADAANDARFQASESVSNLTIRSMMCVPLLGLDGEPLGVINIDTQNPLKQFRTEDLDLLMAVASQAALSFENTRLLQAHAEKLKQDNEMQIAAQVQRALLPEHLPAVAGYEFFASYESAQAVGGDYYDCLMLPGSKVALAFGDVAGKGVPASLVMSRLSSVVQSTLEFVQEPDEAVFRINNHMCSHAIEGRFVTFTLVVIDILAHTMSIVIAGHMSPIVRCIDGSLEEFPEDIISLPLGVAEGLSFEAGRRPLSKGETVVIYTDGVSEAMNPAGELYTPDRLRTLIQESTTCQVDRLGAAIRADVKRHANGREQNDDITLMVFGRTAS